MNIITVGLIVSAAITLVLILLQDRASGTGGAFGGSESGGFYQRRRGLEKGMFVGTIISITLFCAFAVSNLISRKDTAPVTPVTPQVEVNATTDNPNVQITPITPEATTTPPTPQQ